MTTAEPFIWNSEVKDNELDIQNIVNNANYLRYFDQARLHCLFSLGIDWEEWHKNGFNLVLIHVDMALKQSLKAHDQFTIHSIYKKSGRLKIIFEQTIYKKIDHTLVATAINTLTCVSVKTRKPIMPQSLIDLLFP